MVTCINTHSTTTMLTNGIGYYTTTLRETSATAGYITHNDKVLLTTETL
jgi:hypothetical protein